MVRLELNIALACHNPAVALTLADSLKHIVRTRNEAADNITTGICPNPNHSWVLSSWISVRKLASDLSYCETEWIPTMDYATVQQAQRDISHFLMHRYNWIRPHQFNGGLPPAQAEKKLNVVSGIS